MKAGAMMQYCVVFVCASGLHATSSLSLGAKHSHYFTRSPLPSVYDAMPGTHAALQLDGTDLASPVE